MFQSIVGVDMHKRDSVVSVVGPTGPERALRRFGHDPSGLADFAAFLRQQPAPCLAVVEAAYGTRWMLRFLREKGGCHEVRLVDPASVGTRAGVAKTDRRDALKLASKARTGDLNYGYIATDEEYAIRKLLRARRLLVSQRTQLVNAIRGLLAEENLVVRATRLASKKGLGELDALDPLLPEHVRVCLSGYRSMLEQLLVEIAKLTGLLKKACRGEQTDVARRAARLFGEVSSAGELTAIAIAAELGNVERFENGRQVASYAGLVPTTRASGGRTFQGPLSKRGNPSLRGWLGQLAVRLLANNEDARAWAARHARLHGNKRRSALARRVLVGVWASLRTGEVFDLRRALGLPTPTYSVQPFTASKEGGPGIPPSQECLAGVSG